MKAQASPAVTHNSAASPVDVAKKPSASLAPSAQKAQALASYSRLPLNFEANRGQAPGPIRFLSRGAAYDLLLTNAEAVLSLQKRRFRQQDQAAGWKKAALESDGPPNLVRVRFERANPDTVMSGEDELPGKSNYFLGKDPQKWRTGIPNYARVRYQEIYPGIDLVYYGKQGRLEYDFVVAAGAQPQQIALTIEGAEKLEIDAAGDLVLHIDGGAVRFEKPLVYQEIEGQRREIAGSGYLLEKGRVTFRIGDYDHRQPLIIDPVLAFSSYFGGSGDEVFINGNVDGGITLDNGGNIYVAGETLSTSFPFFPPPGKPYKATCGTDGTCNSTGGPYSDIFIAKLNPTASMVLAFTYLGGSGRDILALTSASGGLVVDATGVYVSGTTFSSDFPTTGGAFQGNPNCTTNQAACTAINNNGDGFVTKLDVNLSSLLFSTYLSGNGTSQAGQMQVDSLGNVYVIGQAESGYPASGTLSPCAPAASCVTGFITEINSTGHGQVFSDFLGGSGQDYVDALALDINNNIYVVGATFSTDFPGQKTLLPAATSGGVYTSTNRTLWTALNSGLTGLNVLSLAVNPTNSQILIAGTGQGTFQSTNGGTSWTQVLTRNATAIAFDPLNSQTVYAGRFKSIDGGTTWSPTALPGGITAIAVDPTHEGTVYVGTQGAGVWKSIDGGTTSTQIQPSSGLTSALINSIVIDPTNSAVVYVGSADQGVFVSTNSGANWAQMNNGLVGSNGGSTPTVRALAIDPNSHTTLYAGTNSGVFKTTSAAGTWTQVNNGLSQGIGTIAIRTIAVDPANSQNVYAGSGSAGLFFSSNGGTSWSLLNNLGPHGVTALVLVSGSPTTIYAGTSYEFAFVAKINSDGGSLAYATLLGGNAATYLWGIALDSSNNAYLGGQTYASNFPVSATAFQKNLLGSTNALVAKLNSSGNSLTYASYLGGSGSDVAYSIALDSNQQAWLTGATSSFDFPLANAIWLQNPGSSGNSNEGFVTQFNATGSGLLFSTYLGGEGNCNQNCNGPVNSEGVDITVDNNGDAFVMGFTNDSSFVTASALQPSPGGGYDAFIAEISSSATTTDLSICFVDSSGKCTATPPAPVPAGGDIVLNLKVTNNGQNQATGVVVGGRGGDKGIKAIACTVSVGICESDNSGGTAIPNGGFASLGTLAPGANAQITVTLLGTQPGSFTVTADVRENETDANPADNSVSTTLTFLPGADLSVDMNVSASPSPAQVGSTLTYTANIANLGPSNASNVAAVFTFAPTTAATFVLPLPAGCTNAVTATLTCVVGPVAAGTSAAPIKIAVTVNSLPITATIVVSNSPEADPDPVNNSLSLTTGTIPGANNAQLSGRYAFVLRGFDPSGQAIAIAGSFVADGAGNITGGVMDINSASSGPSIDLTINGAHASFYSVGADNRGQLTLNTSAGTQTFDVALVPTSSGGALLGHIISRQDPAGGIGSAISGVLKQQNTAAFSLTALNGDWAFLDEGTDANGARFVSAGRFTLNVGNLTQGTEDFNDAGVFDNNTTTALSFTGSLGALDTTNGRAPLTTTTPGRGSSDNAVYIVSANEALFISTDAINVNPLYAGSALRQDNTTWCKTSGNCAFTSSVLSGNAVVYLQGNATSVAGGSAVQVGTLTFTPGSPTGTITGGLDENDGGSIGTPSDNGVSANFSVAANGRVAITGGGGKSPYFYLVNTNQAFLVGSDSNVWAGAAEPQVGPIQFTSSLRAIGTQAPAVSGTPVFDQVQTITATSNTTAIATGNTNDSNSIAGGLHEGVALPNFAINDLDQTTGRFTFLDGSNGGSPRVGYFVNPNRRITISVDPNTTAPSIFLIDAQNSTGTSGAEPDLVVGLTTNPAAYLGGTISYTITVNNANSTAATGVVLDTAFSPSLTVNSVIPSQGACAAGLPATLGSFSCTLGSVTQGTPVTIIVVAAAPASGNACASSALGCITTSATVTENEIDANPVNNTNSITTPLLAAAADLAVFMTDSPHPPVAGNPYTYTITVTDLGPSPATGVVLTDVLPANVTFSSLTGAGCTNNSGPITCAIGGLAVGGTFIATVTVVPTSASVVNTASVTGTTPDPNASNNAYTVSSTASENLLVTDFDNDAVRVISLADGSSVATIRPGRSPAGIAVSPNGRLAFVGDRNSNYTSVVDTSIQRETARVHSLQTEWDLAFTPDGTKVVVPNVNTNELAVVDAATFQVLAHVPFDGALGVGATGDYLGSVAVAGNKAFANINSSTSTLPVLALDLTQFQVSPVNGTAAGFGLFAGGIAATADRSQVLAVRLVPNTLFIIDAASATVTQNMALPFVPLGIATIPHPTSVANNFAFLAHTGASGLTVSAVDLRTGSPTYGQVLPGTDVVLSTLSSIWKMASNADGSRLAVIAVPNGSGDNLAVLDTTPVRGCSNTPAACAPPNILFHQRIGDTQSELTGAAIGFVEMAPVATAPVVSGPLSPATVVNNAATAVQFTGSNLGSDVMVRIGTHDPVAASQVSGSTYQVTVPTDVGAGVTDVIVTFRNAAGPVEAQSQSTLLPNALTITNPPAYHPLNQVAVTDTGGDQVGLLNLKSEFLTQFPLPFGDRPLSVAISPDGVRAYTTSFAPGNIDFFRLDNLTQEQPSLALLGPYGTNGGSIFGQNDAIVATVSHGSPVMAVLSTLVSAAGTDDQVSIIDANPPSPTFKTVINSFTAGITNGGATGGIGSTPDGNYLYANDSVGDLIVFNLSTSPVGKTILSTATLGVNAFQSKVYVTPDGNSLLLESTNGGIGVFDISGANRTNPQPVTTITGTQSGFTSLFLNSYQVVGTTLFAYDSFDGVVLVFNFNRAGNNFSQVASFAVPGETGRLDADLAVTPDGSLIYVVLEGQDQVLVLSTSAMPTAANPSSNPIVTRLAAGVNPISVAVSSVTAAEPDLSVGISTNPSTSVSPGGGINYTITVSNARSTPATGVSLATTLSPSLTLDSVTLSQGTCNAPGLPAIVGSLNCNLGTVNQGTPVTVTITAVAPTSGSITANAQVTENEPDFNPGDNSATVVTAVSNPVPVISTISPTSAAAGGAPFTLTVNGPVTTSSGNMTVLSTDVIYAAGNQSSLAASANGTVPGAISLPSQASSVSFTSVQGSLTSGCASLKGCITLNGGGNLNDSDGNFAAVSTSSNTGSGSISGITLPGAGSLVGVFVAAGGPSGTAPPALDFTSSGIGTSFTTLSPLLDQVFFIGDGLTGDGTGTVQTFNVPAGATQLYLGISDAPFYNGSPGAYGDNSGSYSVAYSMTEASSTGFISTSTVNFNGNPRATTFVSATQLTAAILASDIANPGTFDVTVTNPAPGGGTSNAVTFTVNAASKLVFSSAAQTLTTGVCSAALGVQSQDSLGNPANVGSTETLAPAGPAGTSFFIDSGCTTAVTASNLTIASGANSASFYMKDTTAGSPQITVTGTGAFTATGANAATQTETVNAAAADMAVAMTASPSPVPVLGSVTYQITVTNNGPSPATGVVLTDTLPAGTVFASIVDSFDNLAPCSVSNGTLTCNFDSLAVGSSITDSLILVPLAVPSGEGTFDNTVSVAANETDPNLSNNSATQTVQVTGTTPPGGGAFRNLPGFSTNILGPNDDASTGAVPMNLNLDFFGTQLSSVFVNNNGNLTFGSPLDTFTPFPLTSTNLQIIAPFFADVETAFPASGLVTYGNDTVNGRPAFGANWPNVEYCCGSDTSQFNLFQVVLVDRSDVSTGDFDIEFNYDKIQWETGDASDGVNGLGGSSARVGYSNGTQAAGSFFELPGSGVPGSFLDTNVTTGLIYNSLNSTQPGRYVFQVRGGTVQSSADLAIGVDGPQSAAAGSTITYTLTTTNLGPNMATGVVVTDTLPAGFTLVSVVSSYSCSSAGQPVVVTCNVGSLANGANAVITIQAGVPTTASGTATDTAMVSVPNNQDLNSSNNTATVMTTIGVATPDLNISKTHTGDFVQGQQGATYTITVSNGGAGPTTGTVTVADNLPAGMTATAISGGSGSNWICTPASLTCTRSDSLAAGDSYDPITLTVNVDANATIGQVTNTATVSGGGEVNTANDTANDMTNIVAAGLVTGVAVAPPSGQDASGTTVTYAAVVTNNGPSMATSVDVADVLTGNASFVSAPEGCTLVSATSLDCPVGTLANGAQASFMITVQLNGPGWSSNTVSATSATPGPNPGSAAPVQKLSVGGNTVTGSGVAVLPTDSTTGASPAVLTFANVTRGGNTTVASAATGPAPPKGFLAGTPAVVYNLATTAGYTGRIGVALSLNGVNFHNPAKVRLFHYESGAWVDRTVAVSAAGGYAAALVGSLSPFALFEPVRQPPVANPGSALITTATSTQGAKVTLNGSASYDPNGDPLTYRWTGPFPEGNGVATGLSPTVTMPMGANQVGLVVNDGEFSSAPVSQAITVTDFGMATAAMGSTTISAGGSVKFSVTASPQFGAFPAAVTLACTGLPQGGQCNFSSATVNAGGPAATLTITTTPRTTGLVTPIRHGNPAPLYALWMPLPAILLMGAGARRHRRKHAAAMLLLLLAGMMLLVVSCGGGGMGAAPQPQQNGTPAGTFTITVTGTASGGLQHTTTASFTVQ